MEALIEGGKSFAYLRINLAPDDEIITEAGAMSSMSSDLEIQTKLNGSFFRALLIKFLGKESIFINRFINQAKESRQLILAQSVPGEIICQELKNEPLYLQPGAFLACTKGVHFSLRWAGFSSFLAREGLFRIKVEGTGRVWYGSYGAVEEKDVQGEYIVDSGHLLSYPPQMKLKAQLSGGLFSSFFSGEGIVLKLIGTGKIKIQSRSLEGLAGWLNPRFWR